MAFAYTMQKLYHDGFKRGKRCSWWAANDPVPESAGRCGLTESTAK